MPKLPPNDRAMELAVSKFVTSADRRIGSLNVYSPGGVGERARVTIQRLLEFGRSVMEGRSLLLGDNNYLDGERCDRRMILDFMNGNQMPYLMKEASELVDNFKLRTGKQCVNFTQLMLKIQTQLYKDAPSRSFQDEDGEQIKDEEGTRRIKMIYNRAGFNASMKTVDRYCLGFGYCLARWVKKDRPSKEDGDYVWKLAVVPPTDFDIMTGVEDDGALSDITAVVFRSIIETEKSSVISRTAFRHEVWTKDSFAVFIDGRLESVEDNVYGRIPYLYCTQTGNEAERFRQPDMLENVLGNAEINRLLSLSNWAMTFSGMPITVETDNRAGDANRAMVPGAHVELSSPIGEAGKTATIEFKAPQDRTQSYVTHLRNVLALTLQSRGINYSMTDGIKAGTSGVAVEVSMAPILADMKERAEVDKVIETDLYHLLADTVAAEGGEEPLPEVSYVEVDYPFELSLQSAEDRRKSVEFMLKHNLIDRVRALRTLEPERYTSDQEAEAALPEEKKPTTGFGEAGELGEQDANDDGRDPDGLATGEPDGVTGDDNPRNAGKEQRPRAAAGNQED